ncbi:MAG: hypothetical protein ACPGLV_07255 [Bacteroidia bacterium]
MPNVLKIIAFLPCSRVAMASLGKLIFKDAKEQAQVLPGFLLAAKVSFNIILNAFKIKVP